MYKGFGLIPSRFLVLIAHFIICVNLLWSPQSLKSCSMGVPPTLDQFSHLHLTELQTGLGIALAFICLELIAFIFGFTMFNPTSALLSIFCHGMASLTTTIFILDRWQCGWFWWIFTFGSVCPILYDIPYVISVLYRKKW